MLEFVGYENYQRMLDDVIDYDDVEKWNDEETYSEGDLVNHEGIIWLATEAISNNNTPNSCSQWTEAPKFDDECYETTWVEGGLRKIIAWYVFVEAAPSYPQILDVAGFANKDDPNFVKNLNFYLNNIYKQIAMMKKTFFLWNSKSGCMTIDLCAGTNNDDNKTDRKVNW